MAARANYDSLLTVTFTGEAEAKAEGEGEGEGEGGLWGEFFFRLLDSFLTRPQVGPPPGWPRHSRCLRWYDIARVSGQTFAPAHLDSMALTARGLSGHRVGAGIYPPI